MPSTAPTMPTTQAERVERQIRAHKEEVARLREEIGDPQEALFRFVTERFEVESLIPDDLPGRGTGGAVWADDEHDAW